MRWLTVIFTACIVALIAAANLGVLAAPAILRAISPWGDKLGHFLLFGMLNYLLIRTVPRPAITVGRFSVPVVAIALAAAVLLEEASQAFIPSRSCCPLDLAADALGLLVFGWLARRVALRTEPA